jgi:ribonuclease-3
MTHSSWDEAHRILGHRFQRADLLEEALTHTSYVNEEKGRAGRDNERLEFLGDAVLSLIVSEHVAAALPSASEGELSKLKARLVSEGTLAKAARELGVGGLLRLGRGEELTGGREKASLLADTMEALIAALYLDGGLKTAKAFTLRALAAELAALERAEGWGPDHKTQLQEWCQKRFDVLPRYVTSGESGPDHRKRFEVQVLINDRVWGVGTGGSKKEAEQEAAKEALEDVKREA